MNRYDLTDSGAFYRLPTDLEKHCRSLPHFSMTRGMTLLTHDGLRLQRPISSGKDWDADPYMFPDLTDSATVLGLFLLVRIAWAGWLIDVEELSPGAFRIRVHCIDNIATFYHLGSYAEVLVAALEAAP